MDDRDSGSVNGTTGGALDVERDSDVPISTQIYWQLAYQIDSGRLLPGSRLPPVRELGAALRVNPNTIRAVYRSFGRRRLRHESTRRGHPRRRPAAAATRRGGAGRDRRRDAATGRPGRLHRRRGRHRDVRRRHRAAAGRDRSSGSSSPSARTPTPATTPSGSCDEFPGIIEAEGALLDDLPDRLDRFHYDLVATTTFHADEAQALAAGRVPVVAMLVGPGYVELVHEIAGLPDGLARRARLRVGARHGQHASRRSRCPGRAASRSSRRSSATPRISRASNETADLILMSREALAAGLDQTVLADRSGSVRGPTSSTRPGSSCCGAPSSTSRPAGPRRPTPA